MRRMLGVLKGFVGLSLILVCAPLAGCSKPCVDSKQAAPNEPLRPNLKALGALPAGAVQCLDTHPSPLYDASHIVYPKLDPNAGDAETSRLLVAQGWVSLPKPAKVQKADFDAAVGGYSAAGTTLAFRKPGTKSVLLVTSSHAPAWKHGNVLSASALDCTTTALSAYCEGL